MCPGKHYAALHRGAWGMSWRSLRLLFKTFFARLAVGNRLIALIGRPVLDLYFN